MLSYVYVYAYINVGERECVYILEKKPLRYSVYMSMCVCVCSGSRICVCARFSHFNKPWIRTRIREILYLLLPAAIAVNVLTHIHAHRTHHLTNIWNTRLKIDMLVFSFFSLLFSVSFSLIHPHGCTVSLEFIACIVMWLNECIYMYVCFLAHIRSLCSNVFSYACLDLAQSNKRTVE